MHKHICLTENLPSLTHNSEVVMIDIAVRVLRIETCETGGVIDDTRVCLLVSIHVYYF